MTERSYDDRGSGTNAFARAVQKESPLASCFWCERRHPGTHPLSVCAPCAAAFSMMRALETAGARPLSATVTLDYDALGSSRGPDREAWPLSAPRPLAPR